MVNHEQLEFKLQDIEKSMINHGEELDEVKEILEELRDIVQDLDKNQAINEEKQSHLYYRVEHLQQELQTLEARGEKGDDKQRKLVENALMVVLGGIISYIFSLSQK